MSVTRKAKSKSGEKKKHAYLVITVFCDADNERQVMEKGINVVQEQTATGWLDAGTFLEDRKSRDRTSMRVDDKQERGRYLGDQSLWRRMRLSTKQRSRVIGTSAGRSDSPHGLESSIRLG